MRTSFTKAALAGILGLLVSLFAACAPPAPTVLSMTCTSVPSKSVYSLGESLDLGGLQVSGVWSDGSTAEVPITAAETSGFDSTRLVQDQVVTVKKDAGTLTFTVHVIGDLIGKWYDGAAFKFNLAADMSGDTHNVRGGSWSINGSVFTMTFTQTYNTGTSTWEDAAVQPDFYRWNFSLIDGKLYMMETFKRVGPGSGISGDWERVAWYDGSFGKDLCTVSGTETSAHAVMNRAVLTSDPVTYKTTGEGTWDTDPAHLFPMVTLDFTCPTMAPGVDKLYVINVTSSSDEAILGLGDHNWVWITPDLVGIDAPGWEKRQ